MTQHVPTRQLRFYMTSVAPCPYLPGKTERKVFTELGGNNASELNDALGRIGFRRSQNVAYRPSCGECTACVSVRILATQFKPNATQRKLLRQAAIAQCDALDGVADGLISNVPACNTQFDPAKATFNGKPLRCASGKNEGDQCLGDATIAALKVYASDIRFAGRARQGTLWLQDEWQLAEALTLTSGLRGERMAIQAQERDSSHGAVDPSLALRWEAAPGWVARSSLSGAIRFPKLDELTRVALHSTLANTPLEPDRGGNPWLRPERVANLEAGLERHVPGGVWGINTYLRRTQDFIERRTLWEAGRWVDRPYNEGDARHWGLELSAKLTGEAPWLQGLIGRQGSVRAQFTLPRGEVQDTVLGMKRAPRELPRYQFTLGYEGSLPAWQSTWGFQWQHQAAVRTQVPGEVQSTTQSRNLLDAHFVRRLTPALNLRLSVQNLLGKGTWRTASTGQGGQAWVLTSSEAGQRTWLLTLEGKW